MDAWDTALSHALHKGQAPDAQRPSVCVVTLNGSRSSKWGYIKKCFYAYTTVTLLKFTISVLKHIMV